jgi:hypothetical protein
MAEAGSALRRATRAVQAAEAARAAGRRGLDWASLCAWPAWALPGAEPAADALWLRLGALAHHAALARCIDGERLRRADALLGPELLEAIVTDPPALPGPRTLPAPDDLAAVWRQAGQALAVAALQGPALRSAVAAALGVVPAAVPVDIARAALERAEALA